MKSGLVDICQLPSSLSERSGLSVSWVLIDVTV
jgi:hypothetical protein